MTLGIFNWLYQKANQFIGFCTSVVDWLLDEPETVSLNKRRLPAKVDKRESRKVRFPDSKEERKKLSRLLSPSVSRDIRPKKLLENAQSGLSKSMGSIRNTQTIVERKSRDKIDSGNFLTEINEEKLSSKLSATELLVFSEKIEEGIPNKKSNSAGDLKLSQREFIEKIKKEFLSGMEKSQERQRKSEIEEEQFQRDLLELKEDCKALKQQQIILEKSITVLEQEQAALRKEIVSVNQKKEVLKEKTLCLEKENTILEEEDALSQEKIRRLEAQIATEKANISAKTGKQTQPTFFQPPPQPAMPAAPKSGDRETPQNNR